MRHKGFKHTEETKKKIRIANIGKNLGRKHSDEVRRRMSESHKGMVFSEEHKRRLSESRVGKSSWNKGIPMSEETKRRIGEANKGKNNGMYGKRGMLSPLYVNGNGEKEHKEWHRSEWRLWRRGVFERDKYICKMCGYSKGNILQAHHIKTRKENPELKYVLSNGITLCKACHQRVSKKEKEYEVSFNILLGD